MSTVPQLRWKLQLGEQYTEQCKYEKVAADAPGRDQVYAASVTSVYIWLQRNVYIASHHAGEGCLSSAELTIYP